MAKRGRPSEPDKTRIEYEIAGLVYQIKHNQIRHGEKLSLTAARRKAADYLGISEDSVKRAWRKYQGVPASIAAMAREFNLLENVDRYAQLDDKLKQRVAAIKASRGK